MTLTASHAMAWMGLTNTLFERPIGILQIKGELKVYFDMNYYKIECISLKI